MKLPSLSSFTNRRANDLMTRRDGSRSQPQSSALNPAMPLVGGVSALGVSLGAVYDPGSQLLNERRQYGPNASAPPELQVPWAGYVKIASEVPIAGEDVLGGEGAERKPEGTGSGRGPLVGGASGASLVAGATLRRGADTTNLRYVPVDPRIVDPDNFSDSKPVPESQPYRSGRGIISYYQQFNHGFDSLMTENLSGARGFIGRPNITPWSRGVYAQLPQGGPQPAVYRPQPMPWDAAALVMPPGGGVP